MSIAVETTIGIMLIVAAVFLIVAVLLQSGKDKSLSGTITGGTSETFYSKNKSKGLDSWLPKVTTVVAIVFAVLVLISFVIQDDTDLDDIYNELTATDAATTTESVTTKDDTTDGSTSAETSADATNDSTDSIADSSVTDEMSDTVAADTSVVADSTSVA